MVKKIKLDADYGTEDISVLGI